MPLRTIVYDHQTFTLQRFGGISRYICEIAVRINRMEDFRTRVIAPIHCNDYLSDAAVSCVGVNLRLWHPRLEPIYRHGCRLLAPWPMRAARPSLVHRTYYADSYVPPSVPTVVTVHDMIHEILPEEFTASDPTHRQKQASVERADLVLCNSKSTAEDLVHLMNVPRQKVRITHLGLSETFRRPPSSGPSPHPRPYLLFVGHRGGYKNFERALRAYALSPRLRQEFDFLVFGGFALRREEQDMAQALGVRPGALRRLSGSDEELAHAYRHAHAFVYPSRYEGFGIPPLEAMASGCPVACSNVSSIPEVVGDAAELFDPMQPEAIAAALERTCFDAARRIALIQAGHQRLQKFSWEQCAHDTAQAYRSVLGVVAD